MTLGANIAAQNSNWSGGTPGSGHLFRGHSDNSPSANCPADSDDSKAYVEGADCTAYGPGTEDDEATQRRTHYLSNGEVIWDLAGNVWEWTSYFNDSDKPYDADDAGPLNVWRQITSIDTFGSSMTQTDLIPQAAIDGGWLPAQSIGGYYSGDNSLGGGLLRGGVVNSSTGAGVFSARLSYVPTSSGTLLGFRCTVAVP